MTMGTIDEETKEIIGMNVKSSLMVDWAGHNEYGQKVDRIKGPILCSMHRSLKNEYIPPIILPNGDTLLCCKDWSMEYILGNLKNCDYDELFTSEKFKDIVKKMRSENENILCRNCEFAISIDEQNKLKKNYEKLEINPNDEIGKKLDDMYQNLLNRTIDPEGLIFYYNEIKNNNVSYTDIENQIKSSKEYASIPKKKEN